MPTGDDLTQAHSVPLKHEREGLCFEARAARNLASGDQEGPVPDGGLHLLLLHRGSASVRRNSGGRVAPEAITQSRPPGRAALAGKLKPTRLAASPPQSKDKRH
jgi:hypothetical protein